MPAGELIEANCHARLSCSKQMLRFSDKKLFTLARLKNSQKDGTTDSWLRLGYTSVIFVNLGVKVDGTYYCDLLLSQQLPAICHMSSKVIFQKTVPQHATLSDINISQGSVATPLHCGGICNDVFTANFLASATVEEF